MSSRIQAGSRTGPGGWNSVAYGLMSRIGVPSMASRPCTVSSRPATSSRAQAETPRWFGRTGECPARTPNCGHAGLPRGVGGAAPDPGLPVEMEDTSMWENSLSPSVAAGVQDRGVQDQPRHYGAPVILDDLGPVAADYADRNQHDALSHCVF